MDMSIPNSQSALFAVILSTQSVKRLHTRGQLSTQESIWWQQTTEQTSALWLQELRNQGRQWIASRKTRRCSLSVYLHVFQAAAGWPSSPTSGKTRARTSQCLEVAFLFISICLSFQMPGYGWSKTHYHSSSDSSYSTEKKMHGCSLPTELWGGGPCSGFTDSALSNHGDLAYCGYNFIITFP